MTRASMCLFRHNDKHIDLIIHGYDVVSTGSVQDIHWRRGIPESNLDIIRSFVGHEGRGDVQAIILDRIIQPSEGLTHEAAARRSGVII